MTKPFLKWAGGKRWLAKLEFLNNKLFSNRYVEPFVGSGAIFFSLKPANAILADSNKELVKTYLAIKENHNEVVEWLQYHQKQHCKKHYYSVREKKYRNISKIAARFIYLNRTCWNGLYRVNLKGKFNVPIGNRTNITFDIDNFANVSEFLKNASIYHQDFETTINMCERGDLLFIDPPYTVKHNNNNFIRYNEKIFSWEDQKRLNDCLINAKAKGVMIIMTNANHHSINDLYDSCFDNRIELSRHSLIAAASNKRMMTTESVYLTNLRLPIDSFLAE